MRSHETHTHPLPTTQHTRTYNITNLERLVALAPRLNEQVAALRGHPHQAMLHHHPSPPFLPLLLLLLFNDERNGEKPQMGGAKPHQKRPGGRVLEQKLGVAAGSEAVEEGWAAAAGGGGCGRVAPERGEEAEGGGDLRPPVECVLGGNVFVCVSQCRWEKGNQSARLPCP